MIFVSLGTQDKPFNRIIDYVISLKENLKEIKSEKIIIQLGQTKLLKSENERIEKLENIIIYDMLKPEKMKDIIKDSDIIITHAGVGTIMECLEMGKEIIVVPRKAENLEHVNNHQEEIAFEMEKKGFLTKVDTYEELENKISMLLKDKDTNEDNKNMNKKKYISNNEKFNDNLIKYLESI
jgi:UDP-N-acetylglucosamine 2-epimerase